MPVLFDQHPSGRPGAEKQKGQIRPLQEKRTDCKLLTLALIIDDQGFSICSRLYAGNQQETKTLVEMIESLIRLRPDLARNRTVIMDAGIATEANLTWLRDNGFHYIVVHRGKSGFTPDDTDGMKIIRKEEEYTVEVCRKEKDGEALLLLTMMSKSRKRSTTATCEYPASLICNNAYAGTPQDT